MCPGRCSQFVRQTCAIRTTVLQLFAIPPGHLDFLRFENSKAIADFDTKAVSKIDQTWRIVTRRRSVKSISKFSSMFSLSRVLIRVVDADFVLLALDIHPK